jgi:hypothetical protein
VGAGLRSRPFAQNIRRINTVPTTRPKPTDATGVARAKAIKENSDELARRQEELSTIAAAEAEAMKNEIRDPKIDAPSEVIDEIVEIGVDTADNSRVVRLIADIEMMTWGYGNNYSFQAGVKYKVPADLADHLETLGYLYTA